ncbi:MAG: mandelate racemase/muconate lactonizing enzyme family protein [Burkholderiales bacterium]
MGTLARWVAEHCDDIDTNPAAWCAVELALLDLLGKKTGESVEALLGLAELGGAFQYTAVLGDAPHAAFEAQLAAYQKTGFRDFKIKLSGDAQRDLAKVKSLAAARIPPERVRADANNLWRDADEAIAFLRKLDYRFCAIEEPLHTGDYQGMQRIARALHVAIILDESLLHAAQLNALDDSATWIPNVRVSKMGGLLRSLEVIREARCRGLRVIIGAHVGETSLLTRAALTAAHSARDILLAHEGAFGTHLLAYDVINPPIMFGKSGVLDTNSLFRAPGLGLSASSAVQRSAS